MKKNYIFLLGILIPFLTYSQMGKREFNEKFIAAETYLSEGRSYLALPLYLELLVIEPNNANINYKIGFCYLQSTSEKLKATPYLENSIPDASSKYLEFEPTETRSPLHAYLALAQSYQLEYKFDEAIQLAEKYKSLIKQRKEDIEKADKLISECKIGTELVKSPVNVFVTNLGENVNSKYPDYAPIISIDENTLIFTSRREGNMGENVDDDGLPFEDIYISTKDENGKWVQAAKIDSSINTPLHEASIGLSSDGQKLLIYREDNGGDIYVSNLNGEKWSFPQPLGPEINSKFHEPSACFSGDSKMLLFVSDRKGGYGGTDIYVSRLREDKTWGTPENLGPNINSSFDEDAPFLHPDGKQLFFSSKGPKSMGGFDLFYSMYNPLDNTWGVPVNLGYPINTPDDEPFYITSPDGKRAYYVSAKQIDSYGDKDLYVIENQIAATKEIVVIKGQIINDGKDLSNNMIFVTNRATGKIVNEIKANSQTGRFTFILLPGDDYDISYTSDGTEFFKEKITLKEKKGFEEVSKKVFMDPSLAAKEESEPITENKSESKTEAGSVMAPDIQFQTWFKYNKRTIDTTKAEFRKMVQQLEVLFKNSPQSIILIEASASKVPTRTYSTNENLAAKRAESAKIVLKTALSKKGIKVEENNFSIKSLVQGPEYNSDAIQNRQEYEKQQYISISVK